MTSPNPDYLSKAPLQRADGVAQVIKHLPSKYETLSSNPNMGKKKKKKKGPLQITKH
jgi:hypothetical protein